MVRSEPAQHRARSAQGNATQKRRHAHKCHSPYCLPVHRRQWEHRLNGRCPWSCRSTCHGLACHRTLRKWRVSGRQRCRQAHRVAMRHVQQQTQHLECLGTPAHRIVGPLWDHCNTHSGGQCSPSQAQRNSVSLSHLATAHTRKSRGAQHKAPAEFGQHSHLSALGLSPYQVVQRHRRGDQLLSRLGAFAALSALAVLPLPMTL